MRRPLFVVVLLLAADFTQWLRQNIDRLPVPRPQIEDILKQR